MIVDYDAALLALDQRDWKLERFPTVTVLLGPPDVNGNAELTITGEGAAHAGEESVAVALGLASGPRIKKYTPPPNGYVASEPHRPRPGAQKKGATRAPVLPPVDPALVEANPGPRQEPIGGK